ncbi:MAG: hypothetical protein ACHQ2Y_02325 [Candidatus Lutacidiplasmatales archaeon]
MSASAPGLTVIVSRASAKSREALSDGEDEAAAWLEAIWSGSRSNDRECVTCGRTGALQDNHLASGRHGELTVPQCQPCHQGFTEGQDLWDARWWSAVRSPELDDSLLLRGLYDLLRQRARFIPGSRRGAYLSLADYLREQYALAAARTI